MDNNILLFYNNGDSGLLLTSSYSRYLIGGHLYMSAALLFHWNKIMLISIARISFAVSEAFHQKLLSVLICWARFDVCWTYLCGMKMCLFSICAHYWFCSACCLLGGFVFLRADKLVDPRTFKNATLLLCVLLGLFFVAINDGLGVNT